MWQCTVHKVWTDSHKQIERVFMDTLAGEKRSHRERIASAISQLKPKERLLLEVAAMGPLDGGNAADPTVREKAAALGIIFQSSGRLRPHAYDMLKAPRADTPILILRS